MIAIKVDLDDGSYIVNSTSESGMLKNEVTVKGKTAVSETVIGKIPNNEIVQFSKTLNQTDIENTENSV